MNQRGRNIALIAVAIVLMLFAGSRFWSAASDWRAQAEINQHPPAIQHKIVAHAGPQRPDPFRDLNLTDEQRRKIDDIMQESLPNPPPGESRPGPVSMVLGSRRLPNPPPPGEAGSPGPRVFKISFPEDKIRAVLTPEQRAKFDEMHRRMKSQGGRRFQLGGPDAPPPGGPPMLILRTGPNSP